MAHDRGARANLVGLLTNVGLTVLKLVVGVGAGSDALLADAFNSAGDILATAIGAVGYRLAQSPADEDHHYGHGNAESVAGLIIGAMLFGTGLFIALDGGVALWRDEAKVPAMAAAWAALGTVFVKEALYRYTRRVGEALNAPSLLASARDHRGDVLASSAVFLGVLGARAGLPWLDPLAAVLIGVTIMGLAVKPLRENFGVLMDESSPELAQAIAEVARKDPDVLGVDKVGVHTLGAYHVIDLEISVDGALRLTDAHTIAHRVADRVRDEVEHVREVKVHVNPAEGSAAEGR